MPQSRNPRAAEADVDPAVRPVSSHPHPLVQPFATLPMGSALPTSGPAVNPSRDIDTSSTALLIASLLASIGTAVRHLHEKVGAGPADSTSPL
jgi:hypothetical protein